MPTDKSELQQKFIARVKEMIPASHSLVDELSDILKISNDSAYRRIRGETALSIDEVKTLCDHFKISFDAFSVLESGSVTFSYRLARDKDSFIQYLGDIGNMMNRLVKADSKRIIYAAEDIPLFHLFPFPELAAFKMFYWIRSVIHDPALQEKSFDISHIDEVIQKTGHEIAVAYHKTPSTEIWSSTVINSMLKQIEYYHESGLFEKKDTAKLLCDQLIELLDHVKKQAAVGTKFLPGEKAESITGEFTFYYSEIEIGNNCILAKLGESGLTYLSHQTFNNIVTSNHAFCNETENWLNNLMKKSTVISGVSEKQRNKFFLDLTEQVKVLKEKVS
ncbi:MAG: hypothetical protein V2A54_14265 [Bacteroidota bacterium]